MATMQEDKAPDSLLNNWTNDQESGLLRACIQWKPVGMHKHFRMIAIRNQMLAEGLINESDEHTSMPGIWKKLHTLYDLPRLDEREDAEVTDGGDDEAQSYWRDFELPREDFEETMWDRRLAPGGTSSPEMSRRESTVADTDEPRSSPVPSKTSGRGGRAGARKSGRLSRLQNEVETENGSRTASIADEDHPMEDVDDDEDDEDDDSGSGEDETEEDEQEEEKQKKGSGKRGGRGGKRGRGRGRGRKRG